MTSPRPDLVLRRSLSSTCLPATQLLEFQEPTTGVTVQLIGSMHYNPASIALTERTIGALAAQDRLGSVVIESCDLRWNSTMSLSPTLQKLLQSEMRAAHDLAGQWHRPVVLGDQRINVTVDRLKAGAQETVVDLLTPWSGGWQRLYQNITEARREAVPLGGDYLNLFAFLDPKLLLASPVSFVKYPLSYAAKSPLASLVVLALLFLPIPGDASTMGLDIGSISSSSSSALTANDYVGSLAGSLLETLLFARIFLKELLAERNEVIARNILEQCRLQQIKPPNVQSTPSQWWKLLLPRPGTSSRNDQVVTVAATTTCVYAPLSVPPVAEGQGKVVVAVLGMAHCNGIMKLLREQRVS